MLLYHSESCKIFMLKIVGIKLRETGSCAGSCLCFSCIYIWKRILELYNTEQRYTYIFRATRKK